MPVAESPPTAPGQGAPPPLDALTTPALLLDQKRLHRNVARLRQRLDGLGVGLRPHLKTAKSIEVARAAMTSPAGPATVSTLREAEFFAAHGVLDLIYGVGISPDKLDRVGAIQRLHGAEVTVILDSPEQARAVAGWVRERGEPLSVLIEVDADGHRSGVQPQDAPLLVEIGRTVHAAGAMLRGVLTHAGGSYALGTEATLVQAAEDERRAAVVAADALRAAGLTCPVVSVGSTPTAHAARDLSGVTEVRAGVFMFFDLFQAGVGVCTLDDIALSVLTTVIGHQPGKGWTIVDAGWMALSRDRGTARQAVDQGYGVVCDILGRPIPDLIVIDANQEHGIVARRPGSNAAPPDLPVGTRLRILPNHACATGAQHDAYQVLDGMNRVSAEWPRIRGW